MPPSKSDRAAGSPRFQETNAALGRLVLEVFPTAEPADVYGMPGWRVERKVPPPKEWDSTIDWRYVLVALADRTAGLSLHVINPAEYLGLEPARPWLEAAGFKVMRGCLQFNRKGAFPLDAVGKLLRQVKASANA